MLSWLIRIIGLVVSFYYTDLESKSLIDGVLCPILFAMFLIALALKLVVFLGPGQGGSGGGGGFFDGFGGGDGGGDGSC